MGRSRRKLPAQRHKDSLYQLMQATKILGIDDMSAQSLVGSVRGNHFLLKEKVLNPAELLLEEFPEFQFEHLRRR